MVIPNKKGLLLSKFIIGGSNEIKFKYDEGTSVLESCSLVIENRMFIFGGVYDEGRVLKNAYFDIRLICVPMSRNKSVF